jgi:hypothetical protein
MPFLAARIHTFASVRTEANAPRRPLKSHLGRPWHTGCRSRS